VWELGEMAAGFGAGRGHGEAVDAAFDGVTAGGEALGEAEVDVHESALGELGEGEADPGGVVVDVAVELAEQLGGRHGPHGRSRQLATTTDFRRHPV
jgi:hypothetical protein